MNETNKNTNEIDWVLNWGGCFIACAILLGVSVLMALEFILYIFKTPIEFKLFYLFSHALLFMSYTNIFAAAIDLLFLSVFVFSFFLGIILVDLPFGMSEGLFCASFFIPF